MTVASKSITLALQGGGAHGAYTWGVLDRILEDQRLEIDGVSGTSAGAVNAVVMADGLQQGGGEEARAALSRFWKAVSDAARFSPIKRSPLDVIMGRWSLDYSPGYVAMDLLMRLLSPYEMNPGNLNPLRDIIEQHVDFGNVNRCAPMKVFVAATNVRTGRARIFRQPRITLDTVMASACLPFLFQAVEIDGDEYWDGGYMGNPSLFPLVDECQSRDLVVVQVNPFIRPDRPRSARSILNRLNEITFNSSLQKDLRSLVLLKQLIEAERLENERYRDMLLHRIFASELLDLSVSSKLNAEWEFLVHLRDLGYETADQWLRDNFDNLGQHSTLDLQALFADSFHPVDLPLEE